MNVWDICVAVWRRRGLFKKIMYNLLFLPSFFHTPITHYIIPLTKVFSGSHTDTITGSRMKKKNYNNKTRV